MCSTYPESLTLLLADSLSSSVDGATENRTF